MRKKKDLLDLKKKINEIVITLNFLDRQKDFILWKSQLVFLTKEFQIINLVDRNEFVDFVFCALGLRYMTMSILLWDIYIFLCMLIEPRKCEDYITWRGFFLRRLYIDVRYPARRRKLIKRYTHLHVSAICDLIGVWSAEERGTKIRTGNLSSMKPRLSEYVATKVYRLSG